MKIQQPAHFRHLVKALTHRLTGRPQHQHKQEYATGGLAVRSNLQAGEVCENPNMCFSISPSDRDYICRIDPNSSWCWDRD